MSAPRSPNRKTSTLATKAALALALTPLTAARAATPAVEQAIARADSAAGLVLRDRVQARWLPDGHRFWYDVRTGENAQEYVLVDATTGDIRRAASPEALGLPPAPVTHTSQLSRRPRLSRATGPAVTLELTNTTGAPVRIFWIDTDGEQQPYGTLAAGESRLRPTYEGHVWLFTREDGTELGAVTASTEHRTIEIDGASTKATSAPPRQRPDAPEVSTSPDGRWAVRIQDNNVVLTPASDGAGLQAGAAPAPKSITLTTDGTAETGYTGPATWAPDSHAFVLTRVHHVPVRQLTLVSSSPRGQLQPETRQVPYIKPGDPLPDPTPVLFRLPAGEAQPSATTVTVTPIDRTLCPTFFTEDGELDYHWATDSSEVFFDYNQRGHQVYRILGINGTTGAVRTLVEETSKAFIDYGNKTWRHWLPDDRELLWMSERDGWAHLWLYDVAKGQPARQITHGKWVVREVEHVDDEHRQVWFYAGGVVEGESPYYLQLCRVNFDGTGFVRLTDGDGTHNVSWSPDHKWFIDTWSRVDLPPVNQLRRGDDGSLVATLERADISALLATGWTLPERFVAPGRDGATPIYGVIVRPPEMDPTRHYAVAEEVYAGPHGSFAPVGFSVLTRQHAIANLGLVVVQADGMGTNNRGRAFQQVAWKNLRDAGFPDRIAWIRAAAGTRPWMDLARVGIYGGSAGGQTAMRALLDHSDFYSVAVADCGCHDNRMDKIWWNEQWLGWPLDESYVTNSNTEDAAKLEGHLFLMVGELDTNVDPSSTYQVVDRLIRAGKDFDFLMQPGVGHGSAETPYGTRRRAEFLIRNLGDPR